ncbi:MAG: hypothetical protein SGI89_02205 [bacterium]|nr:hypothetical protein [bacterium]
MTTEELKSNIVEELKEVQNEDTLIVIKSILDTYKFTPNIISDKRKEILDEAKQQFRNNEYFTDDDINGEEDKWLKD